MFGKFGQALLYDYLPTYLCVEQIFFGDKSTINKKKSSVTGFDIRYSTRSNKLDELQ
jgi:hypothetical protein